MRNSPAARTLLTAPQLDLVRASSDVRGVWLVAHAWLVIGGAGALFSYFPNIATYLLAVMLIGSRQLGLLILMHDGAHGVLCRTAWLNRALSQFACAFPTLSDTDVYRRYHLPHHVRTQREDDPDLVLTGHYPITRGSLRRKLWRDISGQTGVSQRKAQFLQACGNSAWSLTKRVAYYRREFGAQTAAQLVLALACFAAGQGWLYLALWVVPLLTWQQLVLRVRNIAEHAVVRAAEDPFGNARTTLVNLVERIFVAPYWVNYHLEHHLMMWVPCYRLATLRRFLDENGHSAKIETERGYLAVLRKVTIDGPESDRGTSRKRASGTFASGFEPR